MNLSDFAEVWFSDVGIGLVGALVLIGMVSGAILRWLTDIPDRRLMVGSGILPIFLFVIFAFLTSFGHGALGLTDYVHWRALVDFLVMFCVSFAGAGLGIRVHQSLSRLLLSKRLENGE